VPADLIYRLINEDPDDVRGLAVAGMPIGSPGMEGPGAQTYVVLVFALGPMFFIVEDVLLFTVLVLVKHRFLAPWQKDQLE